MIRQLLMGLWVVGGIISNLITGSEPSIYGAFPKEVAAGQVMNIQITIEKGDLSQFGRFLQELPPGFTAYSDDTHFSFKDSKVKFIWVHLTSEKFFTINYSVQVPAGFNGPLALGGQFSYIFDNEKKMVELNPATINVRHASTPDNLISQEQLRTSSGKEIDTAKMVFCHRQQKFVNDGIVVKIKVHKESLGSMAKIIDTVPEGFSIQGIETKQSIISTSGNIVKFMWINLPLEPEFVVSYKLKPIGDIPFDRLSIHGTFSYSINSITKSKQIDDVDFEMANNILSDKSVHVEPVKKSPIVTSAPSLSSVNNDATETPQTSTPITPSHVDSQSISKPHQASPAVYVPMTAKAVQSPIQDELRTRSDVVFRIQIAAGHKIVDVKKYFKKFNVSDKVVVEQHQGWLKYLVAGFSDYREARDYRIKIWNETKIQDAFVAAYNNGQRITVQEALMISNQKWYN